MPDSSSQQQRAQLHPQEDNEAANGFPPAGNSFEDAAHGFDAESSPAQTEDAVRHAVEQARKAAQAVKKRHSDLSSELASRLLDRAVRDSERAESAAEESQRASELDESERTQPLRKRGPKTAVSSDTSADGARPSKNARESAGTRTPGEAAADENAQDEAAKKNQSSDNPEAKDMSRDELIESLYGDDQDEDYQAWLKEEQDRVSAETRKAAEQLGQQMINSDRFSLTDDTNITRESQVLADIAMSSDDLTASLTTSLSAMVTAGNPVEVPNRNETQERFEEEKRTSDKAAHRRLHFTSPRVRRTIEQLVAALGRLMSRKKLSTISVADISRESGLSRGTIYLYFAGKEDLIASVEDIIISHICSLMFSMTAPVPSSAEHVDQLNESLDIRRRVGDNTRVDRWVKGEGMSVFTYEAILQCIRYMHENIGFLQPLVGPNGDPYFSERAIRAITRVCRMRTQQIPGLSMSYCGLPEDYGTAVLLSACISVTARWLSKGAQEPDEEFARMIYGIFVTAPARYLL